MEFLVQPSDGGQGTLRYLACAVIGSGLFVALHGSVQNYWRELLNARRPRPLALTARWLSAWALLMGFGYLWDGRMPFDRGWVLGWLVTGAAGLLAHRIGGARLIKAFQHRGYFLPRIAVVGAAAQAHQLLQHLTSPQFADNHVLVGQFDLPDDEPGLFGTPGVPRLGKFADLLKRHAELRLDTILVALPWSDSTRVMEVCEALRNVPVDVCLAPDLAAYALPRPTPYRVGALPAIEVYSRPLRDWRGLVKRTEDLVIGLTLLVISIPIMVILAALIRLDSPGPALLRQRRFGYGHEPIVVFKFRTMFTSRGDVSGAAATVRGDARVTRIGRILRLTSLDELPQLINVVRGSMSLVGPRAHPVEMRVQGEYYAEVVRSYAARHRMKPGITGLAQVNGLRGLVDTQEKAQARFDLDLYYVEHWTFGLDAKILLMTLAKSPFHENAY